MSAIIRFPQPCAQTKQARPVRWAEHIALVAGRVADLSAVPAPAPGITVTRRASAARCPGGGYSQAIDAAGFSEAQYLPRLVFAHAALHEPGQGFL